MNATPSLSDPESPERPPRSINIFSILGYFLFGVAIPVAALTIELIYGWSAIIYFNPIPTALNACLVALVPTAIAVGLWRTLLHKRLAAWELHLNSACIGVALLYSILFLPITHLAFIGIAFFGIGLLPLSPLLALLATLLMRRRLKRRAEPTQHFGTTALASGLGIALLLAGIGKSSQTR